MIMVSIVLQMREVIAIGQEYEGSELSTLLGIGKMWASFQEERKIPRL